MNRIRYAALLIIFNLFNAPSYASLKQKVQRDLLNQELPRQLVEQRNEINQAVAAVHEQYVRSVDRNRTEQEPLVYPEQLVARDQEIKALTRTSIQFASSAFLPGVNGGSLFLGSDQEDQRSSALIKALPAFNSATCELFIRLDARAPKDMVIDHIPGGGQTQTKKNHLYNARIPLLVLMGDQPVVTHERAGDSSSNKVISVISGNAMITNKAMPLNDAAGDQAQAIVSLQAHSTLIPKVEVVTVNGEDFARDVKLKQEGLFAAVAPDGGAFGDDGSGIAVIKKVRKSNEYIAGASCSENGCKPVDCDHLKKAFYDALQVYDALNGGGGNRAVALDASLFQIDGDADQIVFESNPALLHWDDALKRLYIGLTLTKNTGGSDAGAVAMLIGRLDETSPAHSKLIIEPAVPLDSSFFTLNSEDHIFGFFLESAENATVNLQHIKTMHTSTQQSYVILAGDVGDVPTLNNVYALPILRTAATGDGSSEANVGKIAQSSNQTMLVTAAANMPLATDASVHVGGSSLPLQADQPIEQLFIIGNTVYASLAQDRSAPNNEAGIFFSTALFNESGLIRGWTSWQRGMGSVDPVYGGGRNPTSANYFYLTADDMGDINTIALTAWGRGESSPGLLGGLGGVPDVGLVAVLSDLFGQRNAGVHQLFDFSRATPSFDGSFSMMVATGLGTVALIETGRDVGGVFTPHTGDFRANLGQNIGNPVTAGRVQPYASDVLTGIGPICSCCVSLSTTDSTGWLFVGGFGGVAVLSLDNGDGWDAAAGLGAGFAGLTDQFTFKQLGEIDQVKKVVCDDEYLYVLTGSRLLRIQMDASKFSTTPAALDEEVIATPFGVTGNPSAGFTDFVIVGSTGALATTQGLFAGPSIQTILDTLQASWLPATTTTGRELGPVVHIFALENGDSSLGNLFVTAADLSLDVGVIYHFTLDATDISPIQSSTQQDYFTTLGQLRTSFHTDGGIGLHTRSAHLSRTNFLQLIQIGSLPLSIRSGTRDVLLDLEQNAYNVGSVVLNSASGALVVPGDWGIRVNE